MLTFTEFLSESSIPADNKAFLYNLIVRLKSVMSKVQVNGSNAKVTSTIENCGNRFAKRYWVEWNDVKDFKGDKCCVTVDVYKSKVVRIETTNFTSPSHPNFVKRNPNVDADSLFDAYTKIVELMDKVLSENGEFEATGTEPKTRLHFLKNPNRARAFETSEDIPSIGIRNIDLVGNFDRATE